MLVDANGKVTKRTPSAIIRKVLRRACPSNVCVAAAPKPRNARTAPPAIRIEKKLVVNSSIADQAAEYCPADNPRPTTHSGGTSDMEIATPGMESAMSSRLMAKAPAAPDASAIHRSVRRGDIRLVICVFCEKDMNEIVLTIVPIRKG
jgi:hypothetical protein